MSGHHGPQHGGGKGPGPFGGSQGTVEFTFSDDNTTVETMTVSRGTRTRDVDIGDDTFETTVGTNALGVQAVVSVERTQAAASATRTQVFTDADGDGEYAAAFSIGVLTAVTDRVQTHVYTFAADGSVTADVETRGGRTHSETLDDSVSYQTITIDGETYVVKTAQLGNDDVRFDISRDDNGDGVWTTVACGQVDAAAAATYVDAATGDLKLSGVADYLDASAAVVG
ncbi:hypothetical protein [Ideonella sp. A 288]|uniref:hypothetical protein n=1 Tax=Ideonella sp. A 288 TaxID=1962181 RepID=UPI000B4BF6C1|nr:hypothetical protein [Ideonella sp. A 288]